MNRLQKFIRASGWMLVGLCAANLLLFWWFGLDLLFVAAISLAIYCLRLRDAVPQARWWRALLCAMLAVYWLLAAGLLWKITTRSLLQRAQPRSALLVPPSGCGPGTRGYSPWTPDQGRALQFLGEEIWEREYGRKDRVSYRSAYPAFKSWEEAEVLLEPLLEDSLRGLVSGEICGEVTDIGGRSDGLGLSLLTIERWRIRRLPVGHPPEEVLDRYERLLKACTAWKREWRGRQNIYRDGSDVALAALEDLQNYLNQLPRLPEPEIAARAAALLAEYPEQSRRAASNHAQRYLERLERMARDHSGTPDILPPGGSASWMIYPSFNRLRRWPFFSTNGLVRERAQTLETLLDLAQTGVPPEEFGRRYKTLFEEGRYRLPPEPRRLKRRSATYIDIPPDVYRLTTLGPSRLKAQEIADHWRRDPAALEELRASAIDPATGRPFLLLEATLKDPGKSPRPILFIAGGSGWYGGPPYFWNSMFDNAPWLRLLPVPGNYHWTMIVHRPEPEPLAMTN